MERLRNFGRNPCCSCRISLRQGVFLIAYLNMFAALLQAAANVTLAASAISEMGLESNNSTNTSSSMGNLPRRAASGGQKVFVSLDFLDLVFAMIGFGLGFSLRKGVKETNLLHCRIWFLGNGILVVFHIIIVVVDFLIGETVPGILTAIFFSVQIYFMIVVATFMMQMHALGLQPGQDLYVLDRREERPF